MLSEYNIHVKNYFMKHKDATMTAAAAAWKAMKPVEKVKKVKKAKKAEKLGKAEKSEKTETAETAEKAEKVKELVPKLLSVFKNSYSQYVEYQDEVYKIQCFMGNMGYSFRNQHHNNILVLKQVGVASEYQGKGKFSILLAALLNIAEKMNKVLVIEQVVNPTLAMMLVRKGFEADNDSYIRSVDIAKLS